MHSGKQRAFASKERGLPSRKRAFPSRKRTVHFTFCVFRSGPLNTLTKLGIEKRKGKEVLLELLQRVGDALAWVCVGQARARRLPGRPRGAPGEANE